jgi:hypothetical protein
MVQLPTWGYFYLNSPHVKHVINSVGLVRILIILAPLWCSVAVCFQPSTVYPSDTAVDPSS